MAVLDFEEHGWSRPVGAGRIVADKLRSRLSGRWFQPIERAQINKILEEHDLQAAGVVDSESRREIGRLAGASLIVLGSVAREEQVTVTAHLVDASTGGIVREGSVMAGTLAQIDASLDELAAVLSASDVTYQQVEARRQEAGKAKLLASLRPDSEVRRSGRDLIVTLRMSARGKREIRVVQEARQRLRELYATFCREELGLGVSKSELMDYCRRNEECLDVTNSGHTKELVFRVPLPD
ncbi:MAG: hypothetical protein JXQ75_11040 [Phycisphaerae bacterium]|nr:hypothetical protein [Phycisphaerae bacterium]